MSQFWDEWADSPNKPGKLNAQTVVIKALLPMGQSFADVTPFCSDFISGIRSNLFLLG